MGNRKRQGRSFSPVDDFSPRRSKRNKSGQTVTYRPECASLEASNSSIAEDEPRDEAPDTVPGLKVISADSRTSEAKRTTRSTEALLTDLEKRNDQKRQHTNIAINLMIASEITAISVSSGTAGQKFHVHVDLLTFHSEFFNTIFKILLSKDRLEVPSTDALAFAQFNQWMIYCDINPQIQSNSTKEPEICSHHGLEALWILGIRFECPSFMNYCLDSLRDHARSARWPSAPQADYIYQHTAPVAGAKIRKFAAACLSINNPFRNDPNNSEWTHLLTANPALSLDINIAASRNWAWDDESKPWDEDCRYVFAEKEESMAVKYEREVGKRSISAIRDAAEKGCVRSLFELGYLNLRGLQS